MPIGSINTAAQNKAENTSILNTAVQTSKQGGYSELSSPTKRLAEQCLLSAYLSWFEQAAKTRVYKNFVVIDGQPELIVSILTSNSSHVLVNNLTSAQKALLVPKLRLFKRVYKNLIPTFGEIPEEIEIHFDDHLTEKTLAHIISSREGRGGGVGVSSFNVVNKGQMQPETIAANQATLKIFAQSLDDLNLQQTSPDTETEIRILDLVNYLQDRVPGYNSKHYELRVTIGWSVSCDADESIFPAEIKSALREASITYVLSLQQHELTFRENGSIDLTIDYQGAIQLGTATTSADILGSKQYDIQKLGYEVEQKERKINEIQDNKIKHANADGTGTEVYDKETETVTNERKEIAKNLERIKSDIYQQFLRRLLDGNKVFYTQFPMKELNEWIREEKGDMIAMASLKRRTFKHSGQDNSVLTAAPTNVNASTAQIYNALEDRLKSDPAENKTSDFMDKFVLNSVSDGMVTVNYLYIGDIIDTALEFCFGSVMPSDLFFLAAPVYFTNPFTNEFDTINIADIPVTLNQFLAWFLGSVVNPGFDRYPLDKFFKSLMGELIQPALQSACTDKPFDKVNANINMTLITSAKLNTGEERLTKKPAETFGYQRLNLTENDELQSLLESNSRCDNKNPRDIVNYVVLHGTAPGIAELDLKKTDEDVEERDRKYGITWLRWGSDRGMIKSMKFRKKDVKGMVESAILRNAQKNEPSQISIMRRLYDVEITMIGNPFFSNGKIVYIDPSALVQKSSNSHVPHDLGLSGYYMVIEAESTVAPGRYETVLQCQRTGGFIR